MHKFLTKHVDKIAHFSGMYVIADICFKLGFSVLLIAILTFAVAMGKEIFDKVFTKQWSFIDFVATFLGGILAIIINQ